MTDQLSALLEFLPAVWEGIQVTLILTLAGAAGALVIAIVLGSR